MKRLLITGATGFIGKALTHELLLHGYEVTASIRNTTSGLPAQIKTFKTGDLASSTDWSSALKNIDTVIHTAARVHIMHDDSKNPLAEFRKINVDATLKLAQQSSELGVKRFIFISSIKASGETTNPNHTLTPNDSFLPTDPYGLSKYEAEQSLLALAKKSKMEVVIIRPALVYGPYVKGNFYTLLRYVKKGIPLPFGSIANQRSLVALDNLVSFITLCISHPKAANEIFIISDGEDLSTTNLLIKVAKAFDKKAVLLPIPVSLMLFVAKLLGKSELANRLLGSLQVDSSKARELLNWEPITSIDSQLKKIAATYNHQNETTF